MAAATVQAPRGLDGDGNRGDRRPARAEDATVVRTSTWLIDFGTVADARVDDGMVTSQTPTAADLLDAWIRMVVRSGGDAGAATDAGADLLARWSEPHRHYHDVEHLGEVLTHVDELAHLASDPDAVLLAAWFHDAVYAPAPGRDEADSAVLAGAVLTGLGLPRERVATVTRLVRLTAEHDPRPGDSDGAVLCDADLGILGADPERYQRYVAGVRQEYAHVPDEAFRPGRAAVLRRLLTAQRVFRTEPARRRWETAARCNMAAELHQLGQI